MPTRVLVLEVMFCGRLTPDSLRSGAARFQHACAHSVIDMHRNESDVVMRLTERVRRSSIVGLIKRL